MTAIDSRTVPIVVWQMLRKAKCATLDDIRRYGRTQFLRLDGCGKITLRKIEDMIGGVWDVTAADLEKPTLESRLKPGLAGRCFILRDERKRTVYQGVVHCIIPSGQGDLVLIQYFEALFGQLNTMALVPLASMIESRVGSSYMFFEDDQHLRDYFDQWQSARDEAIDLAESKI